jgi:hypothetical protein
MLPKSTWNGHQTHIYIWLDFLFTLGRGLWKLLGCLNISNFCELLLAKLRSTSGWITLRCLPISLFDKIEFIYSTWDIFVVFAESKRFIYLYQLILWNYLKRIIQIEYWSMLTDYRFSLWFYRDVAYIKIVFLLFWVQSENIVSFTALTSVCFTKSFVHFILKIII